MMNINKIMIDNRTVNVFSAWAITIPQIYIAPYLISSNTVYGENMQNLLVSKHSFCPWLSTQQNNSNFH